MKRKSSHHRVGFSWTQNNTIRWYSKRVDSIYSSNIKVDWKWKQNNTYRGQKFFTGTAAKNATGLEYYDVDHNPFPIKYGHCGNKILHNLTHLKLVQRGHNRNEEQKYQTIKMDKVLTRESNEKLRCSDQVDDEVW